MTYLKASSKDKEAVQRLFTKSVLDYSKLFLSRRSGSNFGFRQRLTLAAHLTSEISGRLLDCACGTGEITTAILSSGHFTSATVVDLSPSMLEIARKRIETEIIGPKTRQMEFVSSDIFEFASQPPTEPYDLILCLGLIAHTGRLEDLLAKLKRLLSPTGSILLQSTLLDHIGTKVVRALTHERYYRRHGYRISYFYRQDILGALTNVGLKAAVERRFTVGIPFGDRFWAGMNYRL
jgi:ubiquinone/menaquinone biosynthesis C-methylase UbiE